MKNLRQKIIAYTIIGTLFIVPLLTACSQQETSSHAVLSADQMSLTAEEITIQDEEVPLANQPEQLQILLPTASGEKTFDGKNVTVDASNVSQGYVMVKYTGTNSKIKVQVLKSSGTTYTYNLNARSTYEVFPLSEGNGSYTVKLFENISASKYSQVFSQSFQVKLENQFLPFLYPNQYVNFTAESATIAKGLELTNGITDDLKKVETIYNYVVDTFTYDKAKANTVQSGYLPNLDRVLTSKKGICFDYASVMAAMLRSQNIPAKLVVGYTGDVYHAWINVYTKETGWVDGMIFFDGSKWQMMDPTFASSGKKSESIMKYIGNGSNYKAKYTY
ncbi:MAG: transglutaminase-like domain-containing protein [Anaerovorax sp.]|nr:transglutaminase-like domain-containing protein [Anaerovorax sp.]